MPVLHFSGKFRFQTPYYNNDPTNKEKEFDPNKTPLKVHEEMTRGAEPLQYFEFEFKDVYLQRATYDDGVEEYHKDKEPLIGKKILLKGLLVDTSPHLERSRLFAGQLRVIDLLMGKLTMAIQSDVFSTIRRKGSTYTYSASFESNLFDVYLVEPKLVYSNDSRFVSELKNRNLKIHFTLNRFDDSTLQGSIYGCLYEDLFEQDNNDTAIRMKRRRLLIDPSFRPRLNDFGMDEKDLEPSEDIFRNDLEGVYNILEYPRMIIFKYLNCIPFIDDEFNIPKNYKFLISLITQSKIVTQSALNLNEDAINKSGGVYTFKIPENIEFYDLEVQMIAEKDGAQYVFLREPVYDISINQGQTFYTIPSGETQEINAIIYKKNKLHNETIKVKLFNQLHNDRSPIVARWKKDRDSDNKLNLEEIIEIETKNGILTTFIEAYNLENFSLEDQSEDSDRSDLLWDRYYGNYVSLEIDPVGDPIIRINLPVRVLHKVPLNQLEEDITNLNNLKIKDYMSKLFSYYIRFYPWLHTAYKYSSGTNPELKYFQFLTLKDFLSYIELNEIKDWNKAQECISKINHILERLLKEDNDWKKMPRSRDFPIQGVEFIKQWKSSIIDKIVIDIQREKSKISDAEILSIDDWEEVRQFIDKLDKLLAHSSPEDKLLIATCKLHILDHFEQSLLHSKESTSHSHSH